MLELLAQNFGIGYAITALGIGLGLVAVCVPRFRKRYDKVLYGQKEEQRKKTVRHSAAGSAQHRAKYGYHKQKKK